ncbi:MAG: glycosyltransferase [Candidatus Hadarchaeum sp.]|uniref:glycosyltransferase n=1 Tax=Candidatus Hadarchaeum sp. TaxID=2883567 RepID=UPI003D0BA9CC
MVELSIIVPTYNEAENLEQLVSGIFKSLQGRDFELIIVDDNSPDGTGKLADELAQQHKNIRVVHRPGKLGLGTAILDGMAFARGEIIGVIDADLQHPPGVLRKMLERAEGGADIVVASRYVHGGGVEGWSLVRKIVSKGALWLSHLFLPQTKNVKDTLSGCFLFRKKVVKGASIDVKDFKLLIEILVKGKYERIVEVPYIFRPRVAGKSKLGARQIFSYMKQLLRLSEYRILKFMAVGVSGIFVNNGILWLLVASSILPPLFAEIFSIEASILSNFILNNFWTFKGRASGGIIYRLLKYHGSVLVGAVVNYVVFALLLSLGLHILVANTIGILIGFIFNYLLSETFVWRWV